jgi:DNA invertase Pin-like site-specific DNA recombinase
MSSQRRLAVSYSRFSDPSQAKGDSQERQDEMFRAFCLAHNLTPCSEVFSDKGRSGYKDEHRKKGRLGELVAAAKDDRFDPGTVVVVEAWDRLGRLRPDKQTDLVAELLRTGVSIGVCRLNDIFSEDDFGTHKWTTLAVFIQMAYQESKQKAERVAASWQRRRERAREAARAGKSPSRVALLTGRLPAWMECVKGEVRLIPERAAAIRRIFELSAQGYGEARIVERLTQEKVPAFGKKVVRPERTRSQFSGHWTRPYVALILNDRRAVGEMQPRKLNDEPDGPPLRDYYPAVVSEEEFLLARAGQEARGTKLKGRGRGQRQARHVNTFKGMLVHARDGEGMMMHNKGARGGDQGRAMILVNTSGVEGRTPCYTFPYLVFETAVLKRLREIDPADVLPKKGKGPSRADVLRAKLRNVRQDMQGLKADLKAGYSKALAAVLREKEAEEEAVGKELQEELAKAVRPAEKAWKDLPTLADLIAREGDDARIRLRPVLRRLIEDARVLIVRRGAWAMCAVQFFFTGGARRDYLIAYRPAANQRPALFPEPRSLSPEHATDLDLRDPAHVARLEKALAAVELG